MQQQTTVADIQDAESVNGFPSVQFDVATAEPVRAGQTHIHLDLEGLRCFEAVHQQYQQLGVTFNNAIALQPSNPAFPPHSGSMVLMGAPKNGFLEAIFTKPAFYVSAYATGSRCTVASAFDDSGQLLETVQTTGANLANPEDPGNANQLLCLTANGIHRVVFQCLGGQFTLDGFSFVIDRTP